MGEKQPIRNDPKDVKPAVNTNGPLSQPETKPFYGFAIGGVFMAPRPELTPEQQEDLKEIIRNISQHRS